MEREKERRLVRTISIGQREEVNGRVEQLDSDCFYLIECRLNGFCLRSEPKAWRQGDPLHITGNLLQKDCMKQLWMFKQIPSLSFTSPPQYQIVHVKTDLVLTMVDFQAQLQKGELKANQKFEILPWKNGFVRIKDFTGSILRLEGVLQGAEFNDREDSQFFRLNSMGVFDVDSLRDTVFILTDDKVRGLDLVNAARAGEHEIVIYKRNLRMNQRWRLQVVEVVKELGREERKGQLRVHIRSALSGMYVVRDREGEGLLQASYPEEWLLEETDLNDFIYIKHVNDKEYLSYTPDGQIFFAITKKPKWYLQNGKEGLHLRKMAVNRTITI